MVITVCKKRVSCAYIMPWHVISKYVFMYGLWLWKEKVWRKSLVLYVVYLRNTRVLQTKDDFNYCIFLWKLLGTIRRSFHSILKWGIEINSRISQKNRTCHSDCFAIFSQIKKIDENNNLKIDLFSNKSEVVKRLLDYCKLFTGKVCFIKNRTIVVYSYVLQWFDF